MVFKKKIVAGLLGLSIIIPTSAQAYYVGVQDSYIVGNDRYETAGLIADKQKYTTAILVNSDNSLSDGLSASGLAGTLNCPILLVKKHSIPTETLNRLKGVDKVYIIGGEGSISKDVETLLKNKKIVIERIEGKDRVETSYNVAKKVNSLSSVDTMFLVNGYKGEADAMSVAPVSARDKSPIILTDGKDIPFDSTKVNTYAIGGASTISQELVDKTQSARLAGNDRFETNKKVIEHFYRKPTEFFLTKGYGLVDALTVSPLAKEKPVVLVHNNSDKSILKDAVKFTVIGGIDKKTIQQAVDAMDASKPQSQEVKVEYLPELSMETFNLLNEFRKNHGVEPLKYSQAEADRAKARAEYNAKNNESGHDFEQISIMSGIDRTAKDFIKSWAESPGHKASMLRETSKIGGVAVYRANHNNGYGDIYYVVASHTDDKEWNGKEISIVSE